MRLHVNIENGRAIYRKHREIVNYIIVGGLTTVVSYGMYFVATRWLYMNTVWATVFSDLLAIAFAYVASRAFVFENKARGAVGIAKEAFAFLCSRLFSMGMNALMMYVSVDVLKLSDVVMKLVANVVVIVLNYVTSKLFVFRAGKG